jgi:organic hydroperoxide reductase OsmC/OhrA
MPKMHRYSARVEWTGNLGEGTASYRSYSRDHAISAPGKALVIDGSSDPAFRGDSTRYNPEDLLVASVSSCHMLWVLHLCADAGIAVTAYRDEPTGLMQEHPDGSGEFTSITLRPSLVLADPSREPELAAIHHRVHQLCCLARSVNFPINVEA